MNKQKLLIKFGIIGVTLSLALFIFISFSALYGLRHNITLIFIEKTKATAYSIEASIRNGEELMDKDRLLSLIQKSMWLEPEIIGVDINIKEADKLITYFSNNPKNVNQPSSPENLDSFNHDSFVSQTIKNNDIEILRAISPIHISGQLVGTVQIDFDLENINSSIATAQRRPLLLYFFCFLIFILIMFFLFRSIVIQPIKSIKKGVEAIKNLDFDYKIKIKAKDEFGDLAEAFNQMAADLKKSQAELKNYNQKLKQQVEEQTKGLAATKSKLESINLDLEQKVKIRTAELESFQANQEELIKQRTIELNQKLDELEKLNKFMINRENKMIELKKEIEELKKAKKA
jgi:nitrate/nitrite-specific signal transduction histidine kinase